MLGGKKKAVVQGIGNEMYQRVALTDKSQTGIEATQVQYKKSSVSPSPRHISSLKDSLLL